MEAGQHPDRLYGTSAGALNAAWLAAEPTLEGLEALARLWTVVKRRDVFPLSAPRAIAGFAGRKDHLVSSTALAKWLRSTALLRRLEDGVLPLTVVATDLETGEEVLLERGPAVPALLASSAMPGVFPPVRLGGRWLIDGSVVSDTPVGPAVRAGADRVFILPSVPTVPLPRPRSALNVILRSTSISLARHNLDAVKTWSGHCQLYLVPAPLVPGVSPFSFGRSPELIEAAYRLTSGWLAEARPVAAGGPVEGQ
jgi:NTE family protein